MEHDSSRSGYHQPQPESAGRTAYDNVEVADGVWEDGEWVDDSIEDSEQPIPVVINLIWAQARTADGREGAIGRQGQMPWHLKEDLEYFRSHTVAHPVIMGRKTWESLPETYRPLSNRDNIVISHDSTYRAPGATVVTDFQSAVELASQPAIPDDGMHRGEIWVVGGAQIYREALAYAQAVYVTDVDAVIDADAFAPDMAAELASGAWVEESASPWTVPADANCGVERYRFRVLKRI